MRFEMNWLEAIVRISLHSTVPSVDVCERYQAASDSLSTGRPARRTRLRSSFSSRAAAISRHANVNTIATSIKPNNPAQVEKRRYQADLRFEIELDLLFIFSLADGFQQIDGLLFPASAPKRAGRRDIGSHILHGLLKKRFSRCW